jgi:mannose-6-phosphate isomerase-like protein (cupin superfamily)
MASLEEPCFQGEHMRDVLMLTIPQTILYVLGLPIAGTIHLLRNKDSLHKRQFYTRYGLLYLGYRDERAWWELVVAFRKVAVVSVGTFGTLLGVVDIQAHLALLLVFCSITAHLVGKPFDMTRANTRLLHNLELAALCICWLTFWGGLLFFLGHEKEDVVSSNVRVFTTVCLVLLNVVFLIGSFVIFVKEYKRDKKQKLQRRSAAAASNVGNVDQSQQQVQLTQIVPVAADGDDGNDANDDETTIRFIPEEGRRTSVAKSHASFVHAEFDLHEQGLKKRLKKRQEKARRSTQLRLVARRKLKDSKALHRFPAFSDLNDDEINTLIDRMEHVTRFKNDAICHQHDSSESFYIIVKGSAVATIDDETVDNETGGESGQGVVKDVKCRTVAKTCPEQIEVLGLFWRRIVSERRIAYLYSDGDCQFRSM